MMYKPTEEQLLRHIKTHPQTEDFDRSTVSLLETFLRSNGCINCNFACNDKWPNTDGTFELVSDPEVSRRPEQNFFVQIKGTEDYTVTEGGGIKYCLKSLAFPAFIAQEVAMDPGVLFVVLNPQLRGEERVFWKYISAGLIASIDFNKDSKTIEFYPEEEIKNSDYSVDIFVQKLVEIAETHSFIKHLETKEYTVADIKKVVLTRCKNISDAIDAGTVLNRSRDNISAKIFTELEDLVTGTLLLNGLTYVSPVNLRTAWELASMRLETKFLATFLQGLKYIGIRIPEEGQSERLLLKYYGFLWRIRDYLSKNYHEEVLQNLERFPLEVNQEDIEYNRLVASAIDSVRTRTEPWRATRYFIQKKTPFYVGRERYFELTLQLAEKFATKFNRINVYTKLDISSNYSIQIGFQEIPVQLWDIPGTIKVVTNWRVSVKAPLLNKLARIVGVKGYISSKFNEYSALMSFLTESGMNLLDLIDMKQERFDSIIEKIYSGQHTDVIKNVLLILHRYYNNESPLTGRYTIRYILLKLREEIIEDMLYSPEKLRDTKLILSRSCYPFEQNPIIYNLPNRKINQNTVSRDVIRVAGIKKTRCSMPYIRIKHFINETGEIFFSRELIEGKDENAIQKYNSTLTAWDKQKGYSIQEHKGYVYIVNYALETALIMKLLLNFSKQGNSGQRTLNKKYVSEIEDKLEDSAKRAALLNAFIYSRVMMIYGAAGTGKTTLMNYISNLMEGRKKLFLTKTHTALENMRRRIRDRGASSVFSSIDRLVRSKEKLEYDLVFIDECSTIDNRTMRLLLQNVAPGTLLVLAGDTYQIEPIDFGNWFFYAKDILPSKSIVELTNTWRTDKEDIKKLWEEVRQKKPLVTEIMTIDGPFSENIGKNIFEKSDDDEVVLCLNYDGRYGLNCINNYFQYTNPDPEVFAWQEWRYKRGDPVLFNENKRFPLLYNNLKGKIVDIEKGSDSITFTLDIDLILTEIDARGNDFTYISSDGEKTRIQLTVYSHDADDERDIDDAILKSMIPFQLAYAVSIHKAQGLEYNSVKIIIPNSISERITHGVFYTAITRTKKDLKVFWSPETMKKILGSFEDKPGEKHSLEFIKQKLIDEGIIE